MNDSSQHIHYAPLCRQCVNRRNGRLALAGGRENGFGPVHYRLDGTRVVLMVRHVHSPCLECGRLTARYYRSIGLSDLLAVESSGQINFVAPQPAPRRRPARPDAPPHQALQLSLIQPDEPQLAP